MSATRASVNEFARLLATVSEPIYVVAPNRRIVFVNDACSAWTGIDAPELVGQECHYGAASDASERAAVVAALCPPPEALNGSRINSPIVLPGQRDQPRQVEFIPLRSSDDRASGVLALVQTAAEESPLAGDEPTPTELHAHLQRYRARLAAHYNVDHLLGDSAAMHRVRNQVKLAAANAASVLVLAPPGIGERVGRAIHYGQGGPAGALVPLACPLLDSDLLQAGLRGLIKSRPSDQRPATLLLNEIDLLAESAQSDLSQWLSRSSFPARIISTAKASLAELATRGQFRGDLACALSTLTIEVPPLVERIGDLALLAQYYVEQANLHSSKQIGGCTPQVLDRLAEYSWPGDLIELEQMIGEAHAQAEGPLIGQQDLPTRLDLATQASARPARAEETIQLEEYLASIEHELIVRALRRAKGNKTKAAKLLGMTRPRFYRRLVQLGLEKP